MKVTRKCHFFFFSSQVNMQGYFYEVKISAYFKDLNGIFNIPNPGRRMLERLLPASHEILKTSGTRIFLQIDCFTKAKHISAMFLQDFSGHCLGFTKFYTRQVLGIYFQNTATQGFAIPTLHPLLFSHWLS